MAAGAEVCACADAPIPGACVAIRSQSSVESSQTGTVNFVSFLAVSRLPGGGLAFAIICGEWTGARLSEAERERHAGTRLTQCEKRKGPPGA